MTRCKALLRNTVSVTFASILALSAVGCGGSTAQSPDAAEADRVRAGDRLKGRWMLVDFRPDQPLEPMLGALLGAQINHLAISFDGQWLLAEGIGVRAQRTYVVKDAAGDGLHLIITDDVGATYDVVGNFRGNDLEFTARTSPWQGAGRLTRSQ